MGIANGTYKTDEEWASEGYALIVVHDCGIEDPIYVKRRFSGPITRHEMENLVKRAKEIHKNNIRRMRLATHRQSEENRNAMRVYREYRERRLEEMRKNDVRDGKIPLDEMMWWDLLQ